ncbi:hypothetical protein ACFU93_26715 [Streptomyces sp. NPDC057611]
MMCEPVVVGLGYVGLPLARTAGAAGLTVTGCDVSRQVVAGMNAGRSHVRDMTDHEVRGILAAGCLPRPALTPAAACRPVRRRSARRSQRLRGVTRPDS